MPLTRGSSGLVRAPKLLYTNSIGRSAEVFIYICACVIYYTKRRGARACVHVWTALGQGSAPQYTTYCMPLTNTGRGVRRARSARRVAPSAVARPRGRGARGAGAPPWSSESASPRGAIDGGAERSRAEPGVGVRGERPPPARGRRARPGAGRPRCADPARRVRARGRRADISFFQPQ